MGRVLPVSLPAAKWQYLLWGWCLFTAAWYLFITVLVAATGDADFDFWLSLLLIEVPSGPIVFAWGCLAWTTKTGWIARCAGMALMIIGFLGLSLFAALVLPMVFFSLPGVWRFRP
ncbi:MAG: hypothetical protein AB7N24_16985 [Dehalococcoidia bacterium]